MKRQIDRQLKKTNMSVNVRSREFFCACVCVTMDTVRIDGRLFSGMILFLLLRNDMYRVYSLRMNNSGCVCLYNGMLGSTGCRVLPNHVRMGVQTEQKANDIGRWQNGGTNQHEGFDAVLVHGILGWIHLIVVTVGASNGAIWVSHLRTACATQLKLHDKINTHSKCKK